jgi:hypothetical protein
MPVTHAAPPARSFKLIDAREPIRRLAAEAAELEVVELGTLGPPHPLVYVDTDDREALDALILAGLISP